MREELENYKKTKDFSRDRDLIMQLYGVEFINIDVNLIRNDKSQRLS